MKEKSKRELDPITEGDNMPVEEVARTNTGVKLDHPEEMSKED